MAISGWAKPTPRFATYNQVQSALNLQQIYRGVRGFVRSCDAHAVYNLVKNSKIKLRWFHVRASTTRPRIEPAYSGVLVGCSSRGTYSSCLSSHWRSGWMFFILASSPPQRALSMPHISGSSMRVIGGIKSGFSIAINRGAAANKRSSLTSSTDQDERWKSTKEQQRTDNQQGVQWNGKPIFYFFKEAFSPEL